jgi:pimeloyl-ACP methyl ester carboxylesterase
MSSGVDFIFLHGGVQGGWVWSETLEALALQTGGAFGRALALDIPGCGQKRGRPTDGLGIDEIAADLIGDIEAAGCADALLVGHSQAGTVLPRLVELRPDLFRRVVHISCIAPPPGRTVLNYRLAEGVEVDAEAVDESFAAMPEDPQAVFRSLFCNDMDEAEAAAFLARTGADAWPQGSYTASDWRYDHLAATPASYFICLQDAAVSVPMQERFAARLQASRLVRFDSGHQLMNTHPHALAEALRREAALS